MDKPVKGQADGFRQVIRGGQGGLVALKGALQRSCSQVFCEQLLLCRYGLAPVQAGRSVKGSAQGYGLSKPASMMAP